VKYHRASIRLNGYNYSENGCYFVTICADHRGNVFGETVGARRDAPLVDKKIKLNQNGKIIENIWKTLPDHNNVILDEFIIMPDHIHFILMINNNLLINKGASRRAPTHLGFIIGIFKTECTKQINKLNETPGIKIFQRNYYERIIRNEKEYFVIKKYIKDNPKKFKSFF